MLLYRVENLVDGKGLWYDSQSGEDTSLVYDLKLTNAGLPMHRDEKIGLEQWRSAADSVPQLGYWFTHEDLRKLIPLGFKLYEIDADIVKQNVTEWYTHPLFQEQGVKSRKEMDINILLV